MKTVVHGKRGRGLVFAAVLTVFVVAAERAVQASPIASGYFTASDFSASGQLVINAVLVDQYSNPSREAQEHGGIGPLGIGERLEVGVVGAPASGEVVASASGSAGLALHAQTYARGFVLGAPERSDLANVMGSGLSQAQFGLENKFIAVPSTGFGGNEANIRFFVATRGGMFARTEQDYPGTAEASSFVQVGVSLSEGGCYRCLGSYHFEDAVQGSSVGIDDEDVIEAVIPLGVPITVNAGLFVQSDFLGNAPRASSQFPAGSASGESGASFMGSLLFGVTSTDPVDFVWASDLFFDRQPSVTSPVPVAVPAPPTLSLLAAALVLVMFSVGRRTRRRSGTILAEAM